MSDDFDLGISGLEDAAEIGRGGFATVYRAHQPAFRRTVAVKLLAAGELDDVARSRFERECQAMGSLSDHPGIVTVHDAGFTDDGRPYLVMAHMIDGSLSDKLAGFVPLPWPEGVALGVKLAGALETAHRADVLHRDIKPANVLISPYGEPQLTDFGIARIAGGHETKSGVVTASLPYAPPEVLEGHRPAPAGDLYSLGACIYDALAGSAAFLEATDESLTAMLKRILADRPPDLREHGVPSVVADVIEKAMAKSPAARQQSALELGRELQAAEATTGVAITPLTCRVCSAITKLA